MNFSEFHEYIINIDGYDLQVMIDQPSESGEDTLSLLTMHTHPFAEMFVCAENAIVLKTVSGLLQIHQGEIAIVPPNTAHLCLSNHQESKWDVLEFCFMNKKTSPSAVIRKISDSFMYGGDILVIHNRPDLFTKASELFTYHKTNANITLLFALCELLSIISETYVPHQNSKISPDPFFQSDLSRIKLLEDIIAADFTEKLTADVIAEKLFISPRQLDRIAKKRYGKNVRTLIIEKRIATAAELLRSTNMPAEKIGITVGFSSKSGFVREFSRKYGMSPAAYRKSQV